VGRAGGGSDVVLRFVGGEEEMESLSLSVPSSFLRTNLLRVLPPLPLTRSFTSPKPP